MPFTFVSHDIEFISIGLVKSTQTVTETVSPSNIENVIYTAAYDDEVVFNWPFHKRVDGYIAGTVIDETSVPVSSALVTCLWNKNMAVVGKTLTDGSGSFTIYGLDPDDANGYTIMAQDPTTGTVYNMQGYDKVIPVV